MTKRLILSDHAGEPILLNMTVNKVLAQVLRQRDVRDWYRKHPTPLFAYAPLLYIEVEYQQTCMLLDSMHICIRFFEPQNDAECEAVAQAESLTRRSKIFEQDGDLVRSVCESAQANELMWLTVTGYFRDVPDKPQVAKNNVVHGGTATWNSYEPVDSRLI